MSKKMKDILELMLIIIGLFVVGTIIFFVLFEKPKSEDDLKNYLIKMGTDFYVDFYYEEQAKGKSEEELKQYLSKFTDTGIKISLKTLEDYSEENEKTIEKFKNKKKECDKQNTKVIIYPQDPYGKEDYSVEPLLECGDFE